MNKGAGPRPGIFFRSGTGYTGQTRERQPEWTDLWAQKRYGAGGRPGQGIVERSGKKKLNPATAAVEPKLLADPDIRFFVTANPGHQEGDMLVCLCPLTLRNWLYAAGKAIRRAFQS